MSQPLLDPSLERNPYRPGVGLTPPYLAGRDGEEARFRRVLAGAPEIPANVRLFGLRGVGKTVLLKRFQEIAESEKWATINLEIQPGHNNESRLLAAFDSQVKNLELRLSTAARIRDRAEALFNSARSIVKVSYEGVEWSLAGDIDSKSRELGELLLAAVEMSQKNHRLGLVVLLDEAQLLTDDKSPGGQHTLSALVAAVSTLQKVAASVVLVLCGLPTLAVNLLNARTYTERMFQGFEVGSLPAPAAREAFTKPLATSSIRATEDAIDGVMDDVSGYPYFIQLWGAELWDATKDAGLNQITIATLEEVRVRILARLDQDFYEPRIASLTPAEQDLLLEASRCSYPPLIVSELNGQSIKSPGNVNVLLGRLVNENVLYRLRKGQYEYTAPGFRDFLIRRSAKDH